MAALLSSNTQNPERALDGDSDSEGYFERDETDEGRRADVNDGAGTGERRGLVMWAPTSATASVDDIRSHTDVIQNHADFSAACHTPSRQRRKPDDDSRPSVANTTNLSSPSSAVDFKLLYVTSGLAVT